MSNKNNTIDYVEFPAGNIADLALSKEFFNKAFGWSYQQWGDGYADTQDSGVTSGISAGDAPSAPLPVIYVDDLDAAYEKVVSVGGVITREIFSFPGGRRFHFKEPAGNELAVWSKQDS